MRGSLHWTVLEAQFPDVISTFVIDSNLVPRIELTSQFLWFLLSRILMVLRPVSTCSGLHSTRFHVDFLWSLWTWSATRSVPKIGSRVLHTLGWVRFVPFRCYAHLGASANSQGRLRGRSLTAVFKARYQCHSACSTCSAFSPVRQYVRG